MSGRRKVNVFVDQEFGDFIDAEVVDYDNRNIAYRTWDNADGTVTVHIENPVRERYGGQTTFIARRSREALREMLQGVLAALDRVRPRDQFEEPRAEEFFEPPTFEQPREPWLPRLPSDVA